MISKIGEQFTKLFIKFMPDAFVFALLLTLVTVLGAYFFIGSQPMEIIKAWYGGFFDLLEFGMQIVLIIITGYSIALSPAIGKGVDYLARYIKTPSQVYFFVVMTGMLLSMISFGWIVITCFLARALALRINGVHYPYLVACVYFSMNSWVLGLSSSIPLLLNTENNYLIQKGIMGHLIPTTYTLGSTMNIAMMALMVIGAPLLMMILRPKKSTLELKISTTQKQSSIKKEAEDLKLPFKAISDRLNNSWVIQWVVVLMGVFYIVYHFGTRGLDLNFNIMIFIFLILGMAFHQTPMRYVVSMKHASSNVSGILFQYPFYAGIMGIMLYTGLGESTAKVLASVATIDTYPFFAYVTGGFVNFAIPSAGGEFAVIGPSIIEAVKEIGAGLSQSEIDAMVAKASMSVAYGESLSNMIQPFYLLLVLPIMGAGMNLQARDVMGYLVLPVMVFFILQVAIISLLPI
jgi:short-chain fatty acids transporter